MATVALGLLGNAPAIIGAVGDIVHLTERLFGKGKGTDKKQAAMNLASDALNLYAKTAPEMGLTGAGTSEVNQALENLVEAVVTFYNAAGFFAHSQKAAAPAFPGPSR
jgi:hypothetical protein